MIFSYAKSKLLQLMNPIFRRTTPSIFINVHSIANKNPIIRKISTTSSFVHHNSGSVFARNRMFARTFSTLKSTTLTELWCPRKTVLQLKSIMTKYRKTSYVALTMCLFLRVERVPFSGRRHLVIPSPKHFSIFRTRTVTDFLVWFLLSENEKVLPSTHVKTLRSASVARKVVQGMHDVLGLKGDLTVVSYEPGVDSKLNPGFTVGRQTSYNKTPKRWSRKGFIRGYSTKHLEGREWKVSVIDSPEVNACIALGHIFIYSELLDKFSDDELACVISHELGHTIGRHLMDGVMWFLPKEIFIAMARIIMSFLRRHDNKLSNNQTIKIKSRDIVRNFPCRRLEYEADYIGMMLMASAGYDPQAALILLSKHASSDSPSPYDTHPSVYDRIKYLKSPERMNKAMNLYKDVTSSQIIDEFNWNLDLNLQ